MDITVRLTVVVIACLLPIIAAKQVNATALQIARWKLVLCAMNFLLSVYFLWRDNILNPRFFATVFAVCFSLLLWNRWLHAEIFLSSRTKALVTYRTFELAGATAAFGIFVLLGLEFFGLRTAVP